MENREFTVFGVALLRWGSERWSRLGHWVTLGSAEKELAAWLQELAAWLQELVAWLQELAAWLQVDCCQLLAEDETAS